MKNVIVAGGVWARVALACVMVAACGGEDDADPNGLSRETSLARRDRQAPTINIAAPTGLSTYATPTPMLALSGTAADDQGVSRVTWVANVANGVATQGSDAANVTWSVASIPLLVGDNPITVWAYDAAGNRTSKRIVVTYDPAYAAVPGVEAKWSKVADEGQGFPVSGTQRVRFGLSTAWVERSVSDVGECTRDFFGSDPMVGTYKTCEILVAAAVATATATVPASSAPAPQPPPVTVPGGPTPSPVPTTPPAAGSPVSPGVINPEANDPSQDMARAQLPSTPVPEGDMRLAAGEMRWSDPQTWGGAVPGAGAEVVVPAGKTVVLDTSTSALGAVRVEGTLRFAPKDVALTATSIRVTGAMLAGTEGAPYLHRATITLTGAPVTPNDGTARGLVVQGGRLELYGAAPQPVWTRLNEHADAGAQSLTLTSTVNWRNGDVLAVAPTDYFGVHATERLTLSGVQNKTLSLTTGLAAARWGKLQYVTNNGMSLTPDPAYVPLAASTPSILDERAAVANLSRNIVIQGADDTHWNTAGFGAHVMIMDLRSKAVVDSVEFRRVGQAGALGRYPLHWHMLSYVNGAMVGDATGHLVRNSSVWNSSQRCIVLHGTNGVQVLNNVCQDIKGHAFFLEDAVERRNVFEGNIALKMRRADPGKIMQVHEGDFPLGGPSGFWLTNPDNTVRNNLAADAQGNGFWMSYPKKPLGLSASVPILPDSIQHGPFHNNVAHSNYGPGLNFNWVPIDAAGNLTFNTYTPTVDGSANNWTNRVRMELKRVITYKNMQGGYHNNVMWPDYTEWLVADNVGAGVSGKVFDGTITKSLMIGTSLNNRSPYPNIYPSELPTAFATYHSTLAMRDNTVVNFPFTEGRVSGAWRTNDYYTAAVDKGPIRNPNNRMIASSAGFRQPPPNMDGLPLDNRHWTLSGALWDPHGYWGPKGRFWVYDVPFLTHGADCVSVLPVGKNGKSCDGEYFGLDQFQTDFDQAVGGFRAPVEAVRQDTNGQEVGRWTVGDGNLGSVFQHMRHFAARNGGRYILRFPNRPLPNYVAMNIRNAYRTSDSLVIAVGFNGATTAGGYVALGQEWHRENPAPNLTRQFQPAGSMAELVGSTTGNHRLWQDRANNLVWVKFQGGGAYPYEAQLPLHSDDDLYRPSSIVVRAQ